MVMFFTSDLDQTMNWICLPFHQLTTDQLYDLLQLRVNVFIVEQTCPFPDLDDKDRLDQVHHLLGYQNEKLVACARLLPAGAAFDNVSIGRVATAQSARKGGLGHQLLTQALNYCQQFWPNQNIDIGAQLYLHNFYQQHGFTSISEMYLEDGIEHVEMRLNKTK